MRPLAVIALLVLAACGPEGAANTPPLGQFYFPTGVAHLPDPTGPGRLFVASSDFDKRYDFGSVTALDLGKLPALALPHYLDPALTPQAAPGNTSAVQVTELPVEEGQRVLVAPFAGAIDVFVRPDGSARLFVPTRSEGDYVFPIDVSGSALGCPGRDAQERDCQPAAVSLTDPGLASRDGEADGFVDGKPRAPEPYSVTVDSEGQVWVTHLQPADSPVDSGLDRESFVVRLDAEAPEATADRFISIGGLPANSVAVGRRWAYVSGRVVARVVPPALRLVEKQTGRTVEAPLQNEFRILDTRDVLLSADERRLFLVGRTPDVLLVANIEGADTDAPQLRLVRSLPLPGDPDRAVRIERAPGRGALLAISCSGAGAVALYDDEVGQLATIVTGVGEQPYGLAVQRPAGAAGARLFTANFGDGQVAVIDIADVNAPNAGNTRVVAKLGAAQTCITRPETADCQEVSP